MTAYLLSGNESYFGSIYLSMHFKPSLIPVALLIVITGGLIGGLFSWLVVRANHWLPRPIKNFKHSHPYSFVIFCSLLLASCGLFAPIFGSGAELTKQMLHGEVTVAWYYMPFKLLGLLLTSLTGVPGGIFSPSLSLGAGVANCFTFLVNPAWQSEMLALGMVAVLAGVTRAPLTATFIIIEMTNGHAMIFIALTAAFLANYIARFFHISFYHNLASRALKNMPSHLNK